MKRLRIYADTSVIGGCLDEEFAAESRALLDMVRRGEATLIASDLLAQELRRAPQVIQEVFDSLPEDCLERVEITAEVQALEEQYLASGVVGVSAETDALHVAMATAIRADLIVSWNFKHIVNFEKMRGYNAVNLRLGYMPIEIHTPREVIRYEEE